MDDRPASSTDDSSMYSLSSDALDMIFEGSERDSSVSSDQWTPVKATPCHQETNRMILDPSHSFSCELLDAMLEANPRVSVTEREEKEDGKRRAEMRTKIKRFVV